jgi:hypothetical protein
MKRLESKYIHAVPTRRPLKIYASDPMLPRTPGNRITIDVPNEPMQPGPHGTRFVVVDYDGAHDCFYPPVDLNDSAILMQGGLDPTESDPRFHQQMVYAVAMRTLENFERALGRRLGFGSRKSPRLRLVPHAFHGANAFYDSRLKAILFGYFRADREKPGRNLPGQTVFTCLSHDIIAHEVTHAVVDRLRRDFLEPSNPDVLAFHEAFADIVALFQHFSFQEFLRDQIQQTRSDIRRGGLLLEMAQQFGYATGANQALRSAIGPEKTRLNATMIEPHERGSILVAAVFDAFFATYECRIRDLIRIATSGTSVLPEGDLHPDLVNRLAIEASRSAQSVLNMCIRAFDYLPPVDVTFGDFLRALVTADYELTPGDESGLRGAMIEAFRERGIYPENVASLAEESLIWQDAPSGLAPLPRERLALAREIEMAATAFSMTLFDETENMSWGSSTFDPLIDPEKKSRLAAGLHRYAKEQAAPLGLDPDQPIRVLGFHTAFRVAPSGQLLSELVVQYGQQNKSLTRELGGIPLRGGTTIIAGTDGRVRYVIPKPLPSAPTEPEVSAAAHKRLERQRKYLDAVDFTDPRAAWSDQAFLRQRARVRARLANLHQGA